MGYAESLPDRIPPLALENDVAAGYGTITLRLDGMVRTGQLQAATLLGPNRDLAAAAGDMLGADRDPDARAAVERGVKLAWLARQAALPVPQGLKPMLELPGADQAERRYNGLLSAADRVRAGRRSEAVFAETNPACEALLNEHRYTLDPSRIYGDLAVRAGRMALISADVETMHREQRRREQDQLELEVPLPLRLPPTDLDIDTIVLDILNSEPPSDT